MLDRSGTTERQPAPRAATLGIVRRQCLRLAALALFATALAATALAACHGSAPRAAANDAGTPGTSDSSEVAGSDAQATSDTPSPCATRPLTTADVAQYASVMHAAAQRWANLPPDDRAALAAARSIEAQGSAPDPSAIASMADKLQRASEIRTSMDRVVARERHIPLDCYDAIAGRIEAVVPDPATLASGGPGDADGAVPTPAERARQEATRQQETADSAVVAPRRAELGPLVHQIRMAHLAD